MPTGPTVRYLECQPVPITYDPLGGGTLVTFAANPGAGWWIIHGASARRTAGAGSVSIALAMGRQTVPLTPDSGYPPIGWPSGGIVSFPIQGTRVFVPAGGSLQGFALGSGVNGDTVDLALGAEWIASPEATSEV